MADGFKLGMTIRKNDGTLITVHADDAGEFIALCEEVSKTSEIIEAVTRQVVGAGKPPTPTLPVTRQAVSHPQADAWTTPPPVEAPQCRHGSRVYREGVSKAGKPYKVWSCTAGRTEECDPLWVD